MEEKIMESPDGGKTIYERKPGEDERIKIQEAKEILLEERMAREAKCRQEILQILQKYQCRIVVSNPTIVAE